MEHDDNEFDYADLPEVWPVELIRGTSTLSDDVVYTLMVRVPVTDYNQFPKTIAGSFAMASNLLDCIDIFLATLFEDLDTRE
jgi:hypothetical protein